VDKKQSDASFNFVRTDEKRLLRLRHLSSAGIDPDIIRSVGTVGMADAISHSCSLFWASRSSEASALHRISSDITAINI
jgi:hypothetical protein